jgi:hypothetical protein
MANQPPTVTREAAATGISPKVFAAGFGGTLATIFWIVMTSTVWRHQFNVEQVSTLTGATASFLSLMFGFFVRDRMRSEKSATSAWTVVPGSRGRMAKRAKALRDAEHTVTENVSETVGVYLDNN